jgi:uncharacterized membrane protein
MPQQIRRISGNTHKLPTRKTLMAGIGFELRKLLKRDSLLGMMQAYAYAGIISSGPWVLSIIGILVIGLMSVSMVVPEFLITQFQVSVTYLIAFSLTSQVLLNSLLLALLPTVYLKNARMSSYPILMVY